MLKGTSQPPDKVVGRMRAGNFRETWEYTVEKVAVNAVMAGARPEYFPVILALARVEHDVAAGQHHLDDLSQRGQRSGPPRDRHELPASARWAPTTTPIRRSAAPTACCRRMARADRCRAKPIWARSAIRSPTASCFAENEERSPWMPLHVQKGFKPTDSTVSVFVGTALHPGRIRAARHLGGKIPALPRRDRAICRRCVVLDPIVARLFQAQGINSKQDLIDWCAENARLPARDYWDDQWMQTLVRPLAVAGVEPYATRLKAAPDEIVQMYEPERDQRRGGRRRDPGRVEDVRRQLRHDRLGRRLALSGICRTVRSAPQLPTRPRLAALGIGLVLALLTLVPLAVLLVGSLRPDGLPSSPGWTLEHYIEVWGSAYDWRLVANTLIFAGCSTLLAIILATALSWLLERTDLPARNLFRAMILMPMATPPLLLAIGWALVLAPRIGIVSVALRAADRPDRPLVRHLQHAGRHLRPDAGLCADVGAHAVAGDPRARPGARRGGAGRRRRPLAGAVAHRPAGAAAGAPVGDDDPADRRHARLRRAGGDRHPRPCRSHEHRDLSPDDAAVGLSRITAPPRR